MWGNDPLCGVVTHRRKRHTRLLRIEFDDVLSLVGRSFHICYYKPVTGGGPIFFYTSNFRLSCILSIISHIVLIDNEPDP